jgi:ribosomal protein S8
MLLFLSTTIEAKRLSNWHLDRVYHKVSKNSNINKQALKDAFYYYKKNRYKKKLSKQYMAIADYTKVSGSQRLYIINLRTAKVYRHKIAHGRRSGAKGGRVWRSSNKLQSNMTPYGFFRVGSWQGITAKKKYHYLPIKGLQWNNKKVGLPTRKGGRDIVLHTASYVNRGGRSLGCFAIKPQDRGVVFKKLKTALLYSFTGR